MLGIDVAREYRQIEAFYDEAGQMLGWPGERLFTVVPGVSGWSAAQHLEHVAKANGRTFKGLLRLAEGTLPLEPGRPSLAGVLVLSLGRFPRGLVQAPEDVRPSERPTHAELERSLRRNREALAALAPHLPALARLTGRFRHPRLGLLRAPQWLRFVRIHATHHLTIIREVTSRL